MNRRYFLQLSGLSIVEAACNPISLASRRINPLFSNEDYKFRNLRSYDYWGYLTDRERMAMFLKISDIEGTDEEINEYLKLLDDELRFMVFADGIELINFENVTHSSDDEIEAYDRFLDDLYGIPNLDTIMEVYCRFQDGIGGVKSYNNLKPSPKFGDFLIVPPPALLSGRVHGNCLDKSVALIDLYKRLGFDDSLVIGYTDDDKWHAWTRIYYNNNFFDLDPTFYQDFRAVR